MRLNHVLHSALNLCTCALPSYVTYEPSTLSSTLSSTAMMVLWPGLVSVLQLPSAEAVVLTSLQLADHVLLFKAAALPAAVYAPKLAGGAAGGCGECCCCGPLAQPLLLADGGQLLRGGACRGALLAVAGALRCSYGPPIHTAEIALSGYAPWWAAVSAGTHARHCRCV